MKNIFIVLIATFSIVFGAEDTLDTTDTTHAHISCDELQLVIDSLKVKVDRLIIESKQDNNPLATGVYKDWGTKFYGDIQLSSEPEVTFGYSKRIGRLRYGAGLGFTFVGSIGGSGNNFNGSYGYLKLLVSSPIFMNFMSFSGILKSKYCSSEDEEKGFHLGAGITMESWVAQNFCIYLEAYSNDLFTNYSTEGIPTPKIAFGTRFYFGR